MKKALLLLATIVLFATGEVMAQSIETNDILYHSFRMPQSNQLNPAFFPNKTFFYLQLPSTGFLFGSPLAIGDILTKRDTVTAIDFNNIVDKLSEDNKFRIAADVNILGLGFKIHHTFITFNTRLVNNANLGIPISAVNTLLKGNVDDNGNAITEVNIASGDILSIQSYLEASVGVGHYFAPLGLTVGAHAKLLYGVLNIQTDKTKISMLTDNNFNEVKVLADYQIMAAAAVPFDTATMKPQIKIGELLNIFNANTGQAFDFGAKYDFGPLSVSFSINDLTRGIHWHKNVMALVPNQTDTFAFRVEDNNVTGLINGGRIYADSISEQVKDFVHNLTPHLNMQGDYWYSIPTKINLGASFSFFKLLRAGVLFHGQWDRGLMCKRNPGDELPNTFRSNTTFSLGGNLFNWFELTVASSIIDDGSPWNRANLFNHILNPGICLVFTPATAIQTYFAVDYVSSIWLVQAKAVNLRFGLNLIIGGGGTKILSD